MSTENQVIAQNPVTTSDIKGTGAPSSLLTPKSTPELEDGRIEADLKRKAAAIQQPLEAPSASPGDTNGNQAGEAVSDAGARLGEVTAETRRILGCSDTSYAEILGVKPDSTEEEKTAAWRRLGCLLHASVTNHQDAAKAFEKLQSAAEKQNVNHLDIDEVVGWGGKEKLPDPAEDSSMETDDIPVPPAAVTSIYDEATAALHHLGQNPDDPIALKRVNDLNQKISDFNAAEKTALGTSGADISLDRWCIPLAFFGPHYNLVLENYRIIESDRTNQSARNIITKEKELIDSLIERYHFPKAWTVLTADEHLQSVDKGAATAEDLKPAEGQATINYPWTTARAADFSLIIGVRKQGRFGTQVCIETLEGDGRLIRRLQSASEVGLLEVQNYYQMAGWKNLAEGQSQWSYNDRNDFKELLWVTKSHTKRKNMAARNKDPSADCCVKFHKKGIQILTVSSFSKVLGPTSARAEIEKVCLRDNIYPPWNAGYVSSYSDPSNLEKNPVRRRALQDAQAASSIADRPYQQKQGLDEVVGKEYNAAEQLEGRVQRLENEMKAMTITLNKNMEALMEMFKNFANPK